MFQTLKAYKDNRSEVEVLMTAISVLQDKNTHLENSLSEENRMKLDLFAALGKANRQVEIRDSKFLLSLFSYHLFLLFYKTEIDGQYLTTY